MRSAFFLCLLLAVLPVTGQTALPAASPKLTLAQALSAVPSPDTGLRLTVGADKAALPDSTDALPAGASLSDIMRAFGDITVNFGDVVAVAPSSMVLLNPSPGSPDIAADMSATTALCLLAASLSDSQWASLMSEHGLGLPDLTDDTQRSLFHALFTGGHLYVGSEDPALADLPPEKRTDVQDLTSQIDAVRVRLDQTAHLYLNTKSGGTIYSNIDRPDVAGRLHTYRPKASPVSTQHAVSLRAEVPNTLKPSDLDWESKALQVPVPVAGLKTVGDLVTRVGQQTNLELYADPHYAPRTLTVAGPMTAAPAGDLLRAVCVCVTGTFRKVGPAYVLTDALVGVGVRRKQLVNWEEAANRAENRLKKDAALTTLEHHATDARKLKAFGDPLGVTQEEMAAIPNDEIFGNLLSMMSISYPFAKLSSPQQAWMRQQADAYTEKLHSGMITSESASPEPDLTHNVNLRILIQMHFILPSETRPVDTSQSNIGISLFWPNLADMITAAKARGVDVTGKKAASAKLPPPPPLSPLLRAGPRRALLAHPYTAAEVDALVAAMQKLGLNQLWLNVFSGGASHLKTSDTDILTEALNKTQGTDIRVYAHLNLLTWGVEPPQSTRDLTIDGRDSRQEAIAENEANPDPNFDDDGNIIPFVAPSVTVSAAAPAVQQTLLGLMQDLAARPALAGVVWEDAETSSDVGYTPLMRQAFLRAAHADAVDIPDAGYSRLDLSLPLFDDAKADAALPDQWTKFRADTDTSLLRQLRAAAWRPSGPPLTMLLQQTSSDDDGSFIEWNDLKKPSSQIVLRRETIKNDRDIAAIARKLKEDAKQPGGGFVLDFAQESVTQGLTPLDSLVDAVAAEKHRPSP